MATLRRLRIKDLRLDPGDYQDFDERLGEDYPPIIVGVDMDVVDGYHRIGAAYNEGVRSLWAVVVTDSDLQKRAGEEGEADVLQRLMEWGEEKYRSLTDEEQRAGRPALDGVGAENPLARLFRRGVASPE